MSDLSPAKTHRQCTGHKSSGARCKLPPMKGSDVCGSHGGRAPQVRKKAQVRAEIMEWGLTDETVDPGVMMLRLVAQSARRVVKYSDLLDADYADKNVAALVGSSYDEDGHKSGEYMKGLAIIEAQERDRCARFSSMAHSAGIAKDQLNAAQVLGAGIVDVLRRALTQLGHDPDAPEVQRVVSGALRAIG